MTTLDHRLPSAISDDASLVAVVVPSTSTSSTTSRRHLIQLYRVASSSSSCSLQSTLVHSTDQMQLNELIFCGSSLLVALFGTVEVVVWDLDRGVVAHKFRTQDDDSNFLALSSAAFATSGGQNEPPSFYILTRYGAKLYSQEYQNGKVIRKIKSGKCEEDQQQQDDDGNKIWGLAVTKEHIIVKSPNGIRIMQLDTAKKVGKIMNKGASGKMDVCCNQQIGGGSGDDTLAVLESAGSVVLYSLPTGKELARIPHEMTATSAQHATLQLLASKDSKSSNMTYKLLIECTVYSIAGSSFEEVTKLTTSKSNLVAVFLLKRKLLALTNQIGGCRSIWFDLEEEDIPAAISLDDAETAEDDDANKSSSKRKAGNNQPIMLGPGQAGMEASQPVLKKARVETKKGRNVEDDSEEVPSDAEKNMSIAERLQRLAEAMDDDDDLLGDDDDDVVATNVSFKPKSATTESLKEFLTQALQSGDESLLELALQVQDKKLIARTVKDIDTSLVGVLCNKLTTKMASNPLRSEQLCKWISLCLQTGNFKSHHMMPLRNLLDERVETYPDMLRLEGRLSALIDTE